MTPNEMLNRMSVEEIIRASKNGNQDAVETLYVMGLGLTIPGENQDMDAAKTYLCFAGEMGSTKAAWEAMKLSRSNAYAKMGFSLWNDAIKDIMDVQKMAKIVINDDNFSDCIDEKTGEANFDVAYKYFYDASFYDIALCGRRLGRSEKVICSLEKINPDFPNYEKCKILRGLLWSDIATAYDMRPFKEAYADFELVEPDSSYIPEINRILSAEYAIHYEQIDFMEAAMNLSGYYMSGIPGVVKKDIRHAREILKSALSKVSDTDCKERLRKSLNEIC